MRYLWNCICDIFSFLWLLLGALMVILCILAPLGILVYFGNKAECQETYTKSLTVPVRWFNGRCQVKTSIGWVDYGDHGRYGHSTYTVTKLDN
jgi:hypothetical protein